MLEGGEARVLAELLVGLGELPSTPPPIAEEARMRAQELGGAMEPQSAHRQPGSRDPLSSVPLPRAQWVRIAGLLDLLAGLPSTPPDIAAEASERAERVWAICRDESA